MATRNDICTLCGKPGAEIDAGQGMAVFKYHYACIKCPTCSNEEGVLWKTRWPPYTFRCLDCDKHAIWYENEGKWIAV